MEYVQEAGLQVAKPLHDVIAKAAPHTGVEAGTFWLELEKLVAELGPRNLELLRKRDAIQEKLDRFHRENPGRPDTANYKTFLQEIGYLAPEGEDFEIDNGRVDPEISHVAGPQLVVPITNERYVLNAANARWGSLYDALYGSDVLPEQTGLEKGPEYNPARGQRVMQHATVFLNRAVPLEDADHADATAYAVENGHLVAKLSSGSTAALADPAQFAGHQGGDAEPSAILLRNNGLHMELSIDREDPVGKAHPAGVRDVVLESAVTTILDLEDSVSVVDAHDKAHAYDNLAGLLRGDLETTFPKGGETVTRRLHGDREYTAPDGSTLTLSGRSLMLVRNVGSLLFTDAVIGPDGYEISETILDALATAYISLIDVRGNGRYTNSAEGNVYIVKPKMHGPEETAFACQLFARVEQALGLDEGALKIGVMDEERRTTLNLKECVRQARDRIIFINTGFLDRTGDEIHSVMEAGPMVRKAAMKAEPWIKAYEDWNVDVGLACGFKGRAQIGKGMWPKPAKMREMVETKMEHPLAGADCAWVPSPTAATLHATHYHQVDVAEVQDGLAGRRRAELDDLLDVPVLQETLSVDQIQEELDLNAQSILGYVVRWVEQGIGCSTVPDLSDTGLMEDRATLRISSQHMANWLHHGLVTHEQVEETLRRMAGVVDRQNEGDPNYQPMADDPDNSVAFKAARDLVLKGRVQPNGYTEPILHTRRLVAKKKFGIR
ncbi:malate synthase G [Desulfohalovibrio reitneri]|uniref:malate synthase G n=1 Tax=Desulfohalovibrio reitneri TaxID=1307759 RepID=UPI0004A71FFE|nr:malate synthase G [Desulfohalovibrio reitneri]